MLIGLRGPNLNDQQTKIIKDYCPVNVKSSSYGFQLNEEKRPFSNNFYTRKMPNQEAIGLR